VVLGDLGALPPHPRNVLWLLLTEPAWRDLFAGWDGAGARLRRPVRRDLTAHVGHPAWEGLLGEPSQRSPEFRELWNRHEVVFGLPSSRTRTSKTAPIEGAAAEPTSG
jgi:hypothetical protein